jgi:hypothetical protein
MITYSVSRLEAKEAVETTAQHDAGNICEVVIGLTAESGGYSAYVDGVTGCLNMPKENYSENISDIVNDFVALNDWKVQLSGQIQARTLKPITANVTSPVIIIE